MTTIKPHLGKRKQISPAPFCLQKGAATGDLATAPNQVPWGAQASEVLENKSSSYRPSYDANTVLP